MKIYSAMLLLTGVCTWKEVDAVSTKQLRGATGERHDKKLSLQQHHLTAWMGAAEHVAAVMLQKEAVASTKEVTECPCATQLDGGWWDPLNTISSKSSESSACTGTIGSSYQYLISQESFLYASWDNHDEPKEEIANGECGVGGVGRLVGISSDEAEACARLLQETAQSVKLSACNLQSIV